VGVVVGRGARGGVRDVQRLLRRGAEGGRARGRGGARLDVDCDDGSSPDNETLVTDGPYAELKEALGGYFVLECDSIDAACEWAAKIPGATHGAIEVRPIHVDPSANGGGAS